MTAQRAARKSAPDFTLDAKLTTIYRERGWWRETTLFSDVRAHVARQPEKVAIVGERAGRGTRDRLTYGQLGCLVDRFAGALLELGVAPQDVVAFQLPNWWHVPVLHLACVRIGAVACPIIPILRRREVSYILDRVGARVCIAPQVFRDFDHAGMLVDIKSEMNSLEHLFIIEGTAGSGWDSFEQFFCEEQWEEMHRPDELDRLLPSADSVAQIMFTSGTTGEPKGVVHSHNTMDIGARAISDPLGLTRDDVVLMCSPLGHQTGYLYGMYMPLKLGMKVVYQDIWEPSNMLHLVEDERVTWTMGSTTFVLDACAAAARAPRIDLSSLRYFTCAGSPIPPRAVNEARSRLGVQLLSAWGMTEVGIGTTTRPADNDERVSTSDGAPVEWVEVRIIDAAGNVAPSGAEGRLLVRSPSQHLTYFQRPKLYSESFESGWFDTGDLARVDRDGYVRISGRSKDLIIRGGENVPVVEIESLLYNHVKVKEVAIVGFPDDRLGERACAVIIPAGEDPPSLTDLTEYLRECGVAKQFWPERVVIRDALPKTASGKIQKFVLGRELGHADPGVSRRGAEAAGLSPVGRE